MSNEHADIEYYSPEQIAAMITALSLAASALAGFDARRKIVAKIELLTKQIS